MTNFIEKKLYFAKFIGRDGSLGFRNGQNYFVSISEQKQTFFSKLFCKKTESGELFLETVRCIRFEEDLLSCPYSSKEALLKNWELLEEVLNY